MTDDEFGQCCRGYHCQDARPDQFGRRAGAPTPRPLCDACADHLAGALADIPAMYSQLGTLLGEKPRSVGEPVSGTREPPMPLNAGVDELMGRVWDVVSSWDARVREVLALPQRRLDVSWSKRPDTVSRMCTMMSHRVGVLLALPERDVCRTVPIRDAADLPKGTLGEVYPELGYARVMLAMGGREAGLELLAMHARMMAVCGQTRPVSVIVGVDCPSCGLAALTRRSGDDGVECRACHARLTDDEYEDWTRLRADEVKGIA